MLSVKDEPHASCYPNAARMLVHLWCVDCGQLATPACNASAHDARALSGYRRQLAAPQLQALEQLEEALGAVRGLELQALESVQLSAEQCGQLQQRVRDCREGLRAGREPWDQLLQEADRLLQGNAGMDLDLQFVRSQEHVSVSLSTEDWRVEQLQLQRLPMLRLALLQLRGEGLLQRKQERPLPRAKAVCCRTVEVDVDSLPDECLALIFSFLDAKAVLREVRAVCKRWRGLALSPTAWSGRTINMDNPTASSHGNITLARVLELAPCVYHFHVTSYALSKQPLLKRLALRTKCAAKSLSLLICEKKDVPWMAKLLVNQVDCGRLQELSVGLIKSGVFAKKVLDVVANLNLQELSVENFGNTESVSSFLKAPSSGWGRGSVKLLSFHEHCGEPELTFLLRARASTLEAVEVRKFLYSKGKSSILALAELTKCCNLQRAILPFAVEVSSLSACPRLTSLTLWRRCCNESSTQSLVEAGASIASFLRGASQLKYLMMDVTASPPPLLQGRLVMDAVEALASSGAPRLEELYVSNLGCPQALRRLQRTLPRFPELRNLTINKGASSWDLLSSIGPSTAPKLTSLTVSEDCESGGSGLVRHLVETVLRNPELHAKAVCGEDFDDSDDEDGCPACVRCSVTKSRRLGFYSHSEDRCCRMHAPDVKWLYVGERRG